MKILWQCNIGADAWQTWHHSGIYIKGLVEMLLQHAIFFLDIDQHASRIIPERGYFFWWVENILSYSYQKTQRITRDTYAFSYIRLAIFNKSNFPIKIILLSTVPKQKIATDNIFIWSGITGIVEWSLRFETKLTSSLWKDPSSFM